MSDINDIISEMTTNISNALGNSLKKILKKEKDTKTCLLHMPQIQDIIKKPSGIGHIFDSLIEKMDEKRKR